MMRVLKITVAVAAIFALTAIGAFGVQAYLLARDVRANLNSLAQDAKDKKIVAHLDGAITDLGRTIKLAGGVLNETRDIERDNRADIVAANGQTLTTLQDVDALVKSFDGSQKAAASAIQQTSAALVPVMQQTERDLRVLEPVIEQVTPLLQQSTAIAGNLNGIAGNLNLATADVQHEIHKLVYPPPRKWWQKWITDPLRDLKEMVKFTHPIG